MQSLQLTYGDLITLLSIVSLGMLIIILYQLVFVTVYLRRVLSRWDDLSKEVEALILKPIGAAEYAIDWAVALVEGIRSEKEEQKEKHHHKKHEHVKVEKE